MKKITIIIFLLTAFNGFLLAQEKPEEKKPSPWKFSGTTSLNFTQTSFSSWAAGGDNQVAGLAAGKCELFYQKDKITWRTNLDAGYGLTFLEDEKRKNADWLKFASEVGYSAFKYWNYTARVSLETQFDKGYERYPVVDPKSYKSNFFSPAFIYPALGLSYNPKSNFSLFIAPISGKLTYVLDTVITNRPGGAYGVKQYENHYYEFGASINCKYSKQLHENISISTELNLFSNLLKSPEKVDINWVFNANMKVTKYISANFKIILLYDDDTKMRNDDGSLSGPKVQLQQILGVGFSYNFPTKK